MKDEIKTLILTLLMALLCAIMRLFFDFSLIAVWLLCIYFGLFSLLTNFFLNRSLKDKNPNKFTLVFLMVTGLKMGLSLAVLILMFYMMRKWILVNAISCLVLYAIYTFFEIRLWVNKLNSLKA